MTDADTLRAALDAMKTEPVAKPSTDAHRIEFDYYKGRLRDLRERRLAAAVILSRHLKGKTLKVDMLAAIRRAHAILTYQDPRQ
jgi:hypothetical protein